MLLLMLLHMPLTDSAAAATCVSPPQLVPLLPPPGAAPAAGVTPDMWLDLYSANAVTRAGGGGRGANARPVPRYLVVDVREFGAALPNVLHAQGFYLTPVTLEVRCAGSVHWGVVCVGPLCARNGALD